MPDDPRAAPPPAYGGESYHGIPALNKSPWGFSVGAYIFIGGLSGAAQLLATLARRLDRQSGGTVLRNARYIALGGSAIGAALLVWDLRTPQRFYNMFRIFRPTSPMSIGTYVLSTFGASSAIGAVAEFLAARFGRRRTAALQRAADMAQLPAAVSGAGMSVYTASLLAATSTPLWAAAPRELAARFGTGAVAAGAAALSLGERLGGHDRTADALDRVAALATVANLAATAAHESRIRAAGVRPGIGDAAAGLGAAMLHEVAPLLGYALASVSPRAGRDLSVLSSIALLAGGLLTRAEIISSGNHTADRPQTSLRFAQPENLPRTGLARRWRQGQRGRSFPHDQR